MPILKLISSFFLYFTSLFAPVPSPTPVPTTPLPLPSATPTYQTATFTNPELKYQFDYPANSSPEKLSLTIDNAPFKEPVTPALLLKTYPGSTAIRPFTNPKGTEGFLVKRTRDSIYVFPNKAANNGIVLSVKEPTTIHLDVLRIIADSFIWQ